jgi:poly-gamma-glutamate synthase PgsB/CapB
VALLTSTALLAGVLAFLLWERRARDAALAAVPIRIHVNGTRGKSTVTRLIAAALREAGISTIAKTTGTAARLVLPDGSERAVRRRAPASIREQLWLMREARRLKVRAAVVECMAIEPELQEVSERQMIRSTIGVITNARLDHGEVMGATAAEVAEALGSTAPRGGVLVVGPARRGPAAAAS